MVGSGVGGQFSRGATQAATKNPPGEAGLAVSDKLSIAGDCFLKRKAGSTRCCKRKRMMMGMEVGERKQKERKSLIRLH